MENILKIGFTLGDINGIGPEVLIKALEDNRILKLCTPVIYGSNRIVSFYKKLLNIDGFNYTTCMFADQASSKTLNVINCITQEVTIQPGIENETGAKNALISLEAATKDLLSKKIDALITAPINKNNMQQTGFNFHGHTEYFNNKAGNTESLMLMISENLKIGLVTNHIAIKDISNTINKEKIVKKIEILHHTLMQDFGIFKPTIAVLGLNPHGGDNGLIGDEELNSILPAIKEAQDKKMMVIGPFSADGFFGNRQYEKFDAVLAMYHDQGLIPFKAIAFDNGINFTAGLPFIRTSPDHGTAYNIAGKNIASYGSMLQSIFTAIDIHTNRTIYLDSTKNPLKRITIAAEQGNA